MRYRLVRGDTVALGPGKIQILKLLRNRGSIRQAAAQLEMSYMRAWSLVRTMNRSFKKPLIEAVRGGANRGGATLTATGKAVLELYEKLESESLAATVKTRRQLSALLKPKTR